MLSSRLHVIIWDEMLSSGMQCYHLELMLSSGTKCYHLELMLSSDVIIWDDNTPLFYFSWKLHSLLFFTFTNINKWQQHPMGESNHYFHSALSAAISPVCLRAFHLHLAFLPLFEMLFPYFSILLDWTFSFMYIRSSTQVHLPPFRFHCFWGCWDRTVATLALTTRRSNHSSIYLIHTWLDLIHTRLDLINIIVFGYLMLCLNNNFSVFSLSLILSLFILL